MKLFFLALLAFLVSCTKGYYYIFKNKTDKKVYFSSYEIGDDTIYFNKKYFIDPNSYFDESDAIIQNKMNAGGYRAFLLAESKEVLFDIKRKIKTSGWGVNSKEVLRNLKNMKPVSDSVIIVLCENDNLKCRKKYWGFKYE